MIQMIQMIQMIKRINLRSLTFLLVIAVVAAGSFGAPSSVALAGQGNNKQSRAITKRRSANNQSGKAPRKEIGPCKQICKAAQDADWRCGNPISYDDPNTGAYCGNLYKKCIANCGSRKQQLKP